MSATSAVAGAVDSGSDKQRMLLFWACFFSIVATAFGFIVRAFLIDTWATQFALTETQKGEILGVGLWPFAISIILFSLVIDRIGYGTAMVFAFVCHVASAVMTITATGYQSLYWATFIVALANGTVEAVANPVVATLFSKEKTKWLNILHAGWPGGLVLGGLLAIGMGDMDWRFKVGLILVPVALYGVLMLGRKFPVQERVAAGVSYLDMLKEFGVIGALAVNFLMFTEVGRVFNWGPFVTWGAIIALTIAFGLLVRFAPGNPLFIALVALMIPLAITELGTDSWITDLMTPEMTKLGMQGGWVLVYTSLIMMILRFFAGSIVHRVSPLGLLAGSAAVATVGLMFLSKSAGLTILIAATIYGFGKSFFWPTMLGVVAEQFPRGGALTLNAIAGVGMLGVGVVGAPLLGYIQDTSVSSKLQQEQPAIYQTVGAEKAWAFGTHPTVDAKKKQTLPEAEQKAVDEIAATAKKDALTTVAIFPVIMLLGYLGLLAYFKAKGGYKAQVLAGHAAEDAKFTGGVPGPVE